MRAGKCQVDLLRRGGAECPQILISPQALSPLHPPFKTRVLRTPGALSGGSRLLSRFHYLVNSHSFGVLHFNEQNP